MSEPRKMVKLPINENSQTQKMKNDKFSKAKLILSTLKQSANYICKECGQNFAVHSTYKSHIENHFLEKMVSFNSKKKGSMKRMKESLPTS